METVIQFCEQLESPIPIYVVITGCSNEPSFMMQYIRSRIHFENSYFSWLNAETIEEVDEYNGRWITLSEAGETTRLHLLEKFGIN